MSMSGHCGSEVAEAQYSSKGKPVSERGNGKICPGVWVRYEGRGVFCIQMPEKVCVWFLCIINDILLRQQSDVEEVEESSPRTPEKPPRLSDEQIIRRSLEVCLAWIKI